MTKSILLSVKPEHAVKILNGEKTIEIRKTMPKCELPIDVYLYCTKGIKDILYKYKDKYYTQHYLTFADSVEVLNSKVVAKFTLNKIDEIVDNGSSYLKCKNIYAWHIDNLVIFDKPMELRDFYVTNKGLIYKYIKEYEEQTNDNVSFRLKKAPQSWQYVYKGE